MLKFLKFLLSPEWATFNLSLGGGGGGGAPKEQNVTNTNVPEYLRPSYERLVGKAEALSNSPYQTYGGERIAGFNDLQNQAFGEAQNLAPAAQLQQGTDIAGMAGWGSLQAGQNYANQATNANSMQAYMSPYIQNALNPMMDEARRQSDITGQQNAAQAVNAGAFGGSRFGIQDSERQRNLGMLQNQIYGQGMQNAFQNAQQAQQFGSQLGLQGYGQGLQAAQALGQLGQQQFGQQQAGMQARATAGQQQQGLEQQKLGQNYQDFLNQQNWNKNQVNWLSDILHGAPGSQSVQSMYQQPPTMAQTALMYGMGAKGLSSLLADGGAVKETPSHGLGGIALHKLG